MAGSHEDDARKERCHFRCVAADPGAIFLLEKNIFAKVANIRDNLGFALSFVCLFVFFLLKRLLIKELIKIFLTNLSIYHLLKFIFRNLIAFTYRLRDCVLLIIVIIAYNYYYCFVRQIPTV